MENQTRFDLNAALENLRQELAAQPGFSGDDRRELETHLRASLAELKKHGLNEEEAFSLACRRMGQPQQFAEEFVKADPAKVWRERLFWMATGLLMFGLWERINIFLWNLFPSILGRSDAVCVTFRQIIFLAPIIWIIISPTLGRKSKRNITWHFPLRSHLLFMSLTATSLLVFIFLQFLLLTPILRNNPQFAWPLLLENSTQPCLLIALFAWLMPKQNQKTAKRA